MKRTIFYISLVCFISCNESVKESKYEAVKIDQEPNSIEKIKEGFDFSDFKISKGKIGSIEIGITIEEAETHLKGLAKEITKPYFFGYEGFGKAYMYKYKGEPILTLLTREDSEIIFSMIGIHQELITINGLNPRSKMGEILKTNNDILVKQDLMNNWEYMLDPIHNWKFVFGAEKESNHGKYSELESPSKPKSVDNKANWIEIK